MSIALRLGGTRRRAVAAAAALIVGVVCASPVSAAVPGEAGDFNPVSFRPAIFETDHMYVSSATVGGPLTLSFGLNLHYTDSPLAFEGSLPNRPDVRFVEETLRNRLVADLFVGFAPLSFLEIGVAMPLILTGDGTSYRFTGTSDPTGFQIGELRAHIKAMFYKHEYFAIGLRADGTFPTSAEGSFAGNGLGGGGELLFDGFIGPVTLSLNAGAYIRGETATLDTYYELGSEMTFALGGAWEFFDGMSVLAELYAKTPLTNPFGDEAATVMEAQGGFRYSIAGFSVTAGAGGGTPAFQGLGTAKFRAFLDLRYAWAPTSDGDQDGVRDIDDDCEVLPEDQDGFEDDDGCPDPDNDQDGRLDHEDACPDEAEDFDGFEDGDGCPELDNDGDFVLDTDDKCVMEPEDHDGFQDEDGCPELDNDEDGIPDARDRCPNDAEAVNGFHDEDGCPDYPFVARDADRIRLSKALVWTDDDKLAPESFDILRAFADFVGDHPAWKVIRIDVHVSKKGKRKKVARDARSVGRAKVRAQELLRFLVTEGVEPRRMRLRAVGAAEPLTDPNDKVAEATNSRVEFYIAVSKD